MAAGTSQYLRGVVDATFTAHRDAVRRSSFPPPKTEEASQRSFLHGFLLPFSLLITTLRHPTLRGPYLKIAIVRTLVVVLLAAVALYTSNENPARSGGGHHHARAQQGDVHFEISNGKRSLTITPRAVEAKDQAPPAAPPSSQAIIPETLTSGWAILVWFFGIVSAVEGIVVFFTRRYDDWLGYWAAPLARVKPEDETPKEPKVAIDIKWLIKKLKRRARGYIVFAAGLPMIAMFKLIPGTAGNVLFTIGVTIWGWYWLGVFTVAKSSHSWTDDNVAPSPLLIREIRDRSSENKWLKPIRLYGRIWGRLTTGVNSPAQMFERNPVPFLGMALARVILSLPFIYLFARPIIPVAASRLIAESDPDDRFSL